MDSSQFCARIIAEDDVAAWHELRQKLALFDLDSLRSTLASCSFTLPGRRPRLLFGEMDVKTIRERANNAVREQIRAECETLTADPPEAVKGRIPIYSALPLRVVAGGFLVLQEERFADWARRRINALLGLPTWMGDVHTSFCKRCDHIMANVAAELTYAHDLLGDAVDDEFTDRLSDGLRQLHFEPYLLSARSRDDFWSHDTYLANWKIMTHGESGLAVCAFADRWPEAREALELAADGVIEIFDVIPPEGDWPEGVGYWYATLFLGLRFGLALRRLTDGAVDLLQHPRLDVTGDFGATLISPAGKIFNYGDNDVTLNPNCAEALLMLGVAKHRPNWVGASRQFPSHSPLWLYFDDPAIEGALVADGARWFPASGVATLRRGRTLIGIRSGDSTVGHAHLDSNSFIVEAQGELLFRDSGNWPYAHFLGFFNLGHGYGGLRWNFDALATIGHNAILVDGHGQAYGAEYAGALEEPVTGDGWMRVDGVASNCYPGLLKKWRRSLLLVGEDLLVIRDVIVCDGKRHIEWLLHSDAEFHDDGDDTLMNLNGVRARLVPLLPDRSMGWRVSDVIRRTVYENSNTGDIERPAIRYRSFAPLQSAESFEFLFLLWMGRRRPDKYTFVTEDETWRLDVPAAGLMIRPDGHMLAAGNDGIRPTGEKKQRSNDSAR